MRKPAETSSKAAIEALFRRFNQAAGFFADLPDRESPRAVTVEPVDKRAHIDLYDVALFENPILRGNAMNDFIIDADAGTAGEAAVAEERRLCAALHDVIVNHGV